MQAFDVSRSLRERVRLYAKLIGSVLNSAFSTATISEGRNMKQKTTDYSALEASCSSDSMTEVLAL